MKIVKVASSEGSLGKNIGCEKAADEIVNTLDEIWTNEDGKILNYSVAEIKINKNLSDTFKNINKLDGNIFLGGDHSLTYYLFKLFAKDFKNPGLLIFDAHPDVFQEFKSITHQDWLKFLIDHGFLKKENIILAGIRNLAVRELEYLKDNKIKFFTMKQIYKNIELICDDVMEIANKFEALYLSLDIDVVDPSYAIGTGYLEPGGLSSREILYFIQRLKLLKNLKAIDIVEVNPRLDKNNITVKLAAKILGEFL